MCKCRKGIFIQAQEDKIKNQAAVMDNCRKPHPNTKELTLFSATHGMSSQMDSMFGHKTSFKNIGKLK